MNIFYIVILWENISSEKISSGTGVYCSLPYFCDDILTLVFTKFLKKLICM